MTFIKDNIHLIDKPYGEIINSERKESKHPQLQTSDFTYYRKGDQLADGKFKWCCKNCSTCVYTKSDALGRVQIVGHNGDFHSCKKLIKSLLKDDASTSECVTDSVSKMPSLTLHEIRNLEQDYIGDPTDIGYCEELLEQRQSKIFNLIGIIQRFMDERANVVTRFNQMFDYFKTCLNPPKDVMRTLVIEKRYLSGLNIIFETKYNMNHSFVVKKCVKYSAGDILNVSKQICELKAVKQEIDKCMNIICGMDMCDLREVPIEYEKVELKPMFLNEQHQKTFTSFKSNESGLYEVIENSMKVMDEVNSIVKAFGCERETMMKIVENGLSQARSTHLYIETLELARQDILRSTIFAYKCLPTVQYENVENYDSSDFALSLMKTEDLISTVDILRYFFSKCFIDELEEQLDKTLSLYV